MNFQLAYDYLVTGKPCIVEDFEDLGIHLTKSSGDIVQLGDEFPDGTKVRKRVHNTFL